jgi:hypothetical protein
MRCSMALSLSLCCSGSAASLTMSKWRGNREYVLTADDAEPQLPGREAGVPATALFDLRPQAPHPT